MTDSETLNKAKSRLIHDNQSLFDELDEVAEGLKDPTIPNSTFLSLIQEGREIKERIRRNSFDAAHLERDLAFRDLANSCEIGASKRFLSAINLFKMAEEWKGLERMIIDLVREAINGS